MYKVDLPIARCEVGMITAEPIIDLSTGMIIVGKEQLLTEYIINNLKKFKVNKVRIYIKGWNNIWSISSEVVTKYKKHLVKLKDVLEDLKITQVLNIGELRKIASEISIDFNANYTILTCINMVGLADEYTYAHSMNVSLLSMLIGKWMNYTHEEIELLILMGLVHDVGIDKMPEGILQKYGTFEEEEFNQIKKHVLYGYKVLDSVKKLHLDKRENKLEDKLSKVLSIADIYDMMTSHQLHNKKQSPFEIMDLMQNGLLGQLDPDIILTFINNIASYYIGAYVVLSTGDVGEVVFIHPHCVHKPIIRVNETYIDLHIEHKVKILQIA